MARYLPSAPVAARRGRALTVAGVVLCSALVLTACSRGTDTEARAAGAEFDEPVEIVNCERTEVFDAVPQRIISQNNHVTEILIQMGVGDRIVGMGYGEATNVLPEAEEQFRSITSLAKEYPTREQVLDLEPDFVVAGMTSALSETAGYTREDLDGEGINTFLFSEYCGDGFPDIDLLVEDYRQLGQVLGAETAAEELIDRILGELAEVTEALDAAGVEPVPTFFYDSGQDQPLTIGGTGIGNLIAEYAGAENITPEGEKPYFASSWETIGERAPEAIVILDYGSASVEEKIDYLRSHPIMATTPAVRDDRFVVVSLGDFFESGRLTTSVRTIAEGLHPEAFSDAEQP